ncbi:MAG: hypothetical protein AAGL19_00525 [Pseudomonadota bacterium]
MRQNLLKLATVVVAACSAQQAALACAFHGYTPAPTLVDTLLSTEQVVVAQPDLSTPDSYNVIETLLGHETPVVLLENEATLGLQAIDEKAPMVLLARDGPYGGWMELAVLDNRFKTVVSDVIAKQSSWGFGDDTDRLAYFARLLNDPNGDLRRLALQELDRVSYSALRRVDLPEIHNLHRDLLTGDADLRPIRILLAGLSGDMQFGAALASELEKAIANEVPYMGAYATAWIELEEDKAIREIATKHLANAGLPVSTHRKLFEALAIQTRNVSDKNRRMILRSVMDVLQRHPELKDTVAQTFGFRTSWMEQRQSQHRQVARESLTEPGQTAIVP